MVAEARAGEEVGITTPGTADRLRRVLDGLGLPTEPPAGLDAETLVALMVRDKKSRAARPNVVYLRCIGAVARSPEGDWAHPFEDAAMDAALAAAGR
jgi:3-dehydroquinate synthase